jgi:hypothetical protein
VTTGSGSGSTAEDDKKQRTRKIGRDTWVVIWALTAVTISVASTGQIATWKWAGLPADDIRRFALPAQTELAVIGWLMIGKLAHSRGRSPYLWWGLAFVFAAGAVYLNVIHGTWRQGLIFGGASGATMAFLFAKFYLDHIGDDVDQKLRDGARPKVLGVGSLIQPRIDLRAFLIVRRRSQVKTVEGARELAELWLWVYQDTKAKLRNDKQRFGKRAVARRTAWLTINKECGVKVIEPQGIKVAGVTFAEPAPVQEDVRVPEAWVQEQERQSAPRVERAAPKPPTPAVARRRPVSSPPADVDGPDPDDAPPEMFEANEARLSKAQDILRDWATRESPYTVDEVGKLAGIGNRQHASQVAKCMRTLRRRMSNNTTTAQGGDRR